MPSRATPAAEPPLRRHHQPATATPQRPVTTHLTRHATTPRWLRRPARAARPPAAAAPTHGLASARLHSIQPNHHRVSPVRHHGPASLAPIPPATTLPSTHPHATRAPLATASTAGFTMAHRDPRRSHRHRATTTHPAPLQPRLTRPLPPPRRCLTTLLSTPAPTRPPLTARSAPRHRLPLPPILCPQISRGGPQGGGQRPPPPPVP
jgi:hypothetical protein